MRLVELMRPGAVIKEGFADPVPNDLFIRTRIPTRNLLNKGAENQSGEFIGGCAVTIAQPVMECQQLGGIETGGHTGPS
jgi:hypothetical protein